MKYYHLIQIIFQITKIRKVERKKCGKAIIPYLRNREIGKNRYRELYKWLTDPIVDDIMFMMPDMDTYIDFAYYRNDEQLYNNALFRCDNRCCN